MSKSATESKWQALKVLKHFARLDVLDAERTRQAELRTLIHPVRDRGNRGSAVAQNIQQCLEGSSWEGRPESL